MVNLQQPLTPAEESKEDDHDCVHLPASSPEEQQRSLRHRPQQVHQAEVLQHRREESTPPETAVAGAGEVAGQRGDDEGYVEAKQGKADVEDSHTLQSQSPTGGRHVSMCVLVGGVGRAIKGWVGTT